MVRGNCKSHFLALESLRTSSAQMRLCHPFETKKYAYSIYLPSQFIHFEVKHIFMHDTTSVFFCVARSL